MEIKNKELFKVNLKKEIEKHVRQFPIFFYGNIFINIIILALIIATELFLAFSLVEMQMPDILLSGLVFTAALLSFLSITFRNFIKNIHIKNEIRANNLNFGIDDYELDHAMDFIEQLPMAEAEVERMKVALSFGKIIDLLDLFNIISCEKGVYDIDIIFKYDTESFEIEKQEEKKRRARVKPGPA